MNVFNDINEKLERLEILALDINKCRKDVLRLPELEQEYSNIHKELTKSLDDMDVSQRGNFGWERRIVSFLADFRKQILAETVKIGV